MAWPTAKRWAERYHAHGPAAMTDRSSRPHHSPRATPAPVVRRIVHLRWKQRLGPVAIAAQVGVAPSTAHQVLRRCRINRLAHIDRATGEPVRRYEHPHPGDLLHVDVKKLGNIKPCRLHSPGDAIVGQTPDRYGVKTIGSYEICRSAWVHQHLLASLHALLSYAQPTTNTRA